MFNNRIYAKMSWVFQQAIDNHGVQYPMSLMDVIDCDDMYCGCFFE